jgi:hypothetical protein
LIILDGNAFRRKAKFEGRESVYVERPGIESTQRGEVREKRRTGLDVGDT